MTCRLMSSGMLLLRCVDWPIGTFTYITYKLNNDWTIYFKRSVRYKQIFTEQRNKWGKKNFYTKKTIKKSYLFLAAVVFFFIQKAQSRMFHCQGYIRTETVKPKYEQKEHCALFQCNNLLFSPLTSFSLNWRPISGLRLVSSL